MENSRNPQHKDLNQVDQDNKGIDFSGSLKDFGSGMKFEENRAPRSYYPGTPKIIQWVFKYSGGLVKDEKQANYVLFGFVAMAVVIMLFLIFGGGGSKSQNPGKETFKNAPPEMIPLRK